MKNDSNTCAYYLVSNLIASFKRKFFSYYLLLGCDYLSNIPNIGLGRARKFFESLHSIPMSLETVREHLKSIPSVLNMNGKVKVTQEYIQSFIRAVQTFDHQLVFSPITGRLTHMKNLQGGYLKHRELQLGEYAGDFFDIHRDENFILHYVRGNLHTKTLDMIDKEYNPICTENFEDNVFSIWYSEIVQKRIISKKSMTNIVSSNFYLPDSPIKNKNNSKIYETIKSDSKRTNTSFNSSSEKPAKRVKHQISPISKVSLQTNNQQGPLKEKTRLNDDEVIIIDQTNSSNASTPTTCSQRRFSRNMFRQSLTELKTLPIDHKKTSRITSDYFTCKNKIENEIVIANSPKASSPLKKSQKIIEISESDSEDDKFIKNYNTLYLMKNSEANKKKNTNESDFNTSLDSSIDEEDKILLTSLNCSTQNSSGYYSSSQRSTQNSFNTQQQQLNNILSPQLYSVDLNESSEGRTQTKSFSTVGRGRKKSQKTLNSTKRSSTSCDSHISPTNQKDIRNFFTKRA